MSFYGHCSYRTQLEYVVGVVVIPFFFCLFVIQANFFLYVIQANNCQLTFRAVCQVRERERERKTKSVELPSLCHKLHCVTALAFFEFPCTVLTVS